jgi:hypothetical protein
MSESLIGFEIRMFDIENCDMNFLNPQLATHLDSIEISVKRMDRYVNYIFTYLSYFIIRHEKYSNNC